MASNLCKCGGEIVYFEPTQKVYNVLPDGSIDWDSGDNLYEDSSHLGKAECRECETLQRIEGFGDNVKIVPVKDNEAD